ncbi:MAG TPA: response regulator [Polyangiaceae bacterium]|nr:response regulator [Polyangiaceae bacterium]
MKKRLLLVDDDPGILDALVVALENKYELSVAQDGEQGLRELDRGLFDAIVLDLMMPVLDGASMMRELSRRGIAIPVLVVSASNDLESRASALGAAGCIQKPFDLEQLEQKLGVIIGPARASAP